MSLRDNIFHDTYFKAVSDVSGMSLTKASSERITPVRLILKQITNKMYVIHSSRYCWNNVTNTMEQNKTQLKQKKDWGRTDLYDKQIRLDY